MPSLTSGRSSTFPAASSSFADSEVPASSIFSPGTASAETSLWTSFPTRIHAAIQATVSRSANSWTAQREGVSAYNFMPPILTPLPPQISDDTGSSGQRLR
jgi:hypothetical protein